MLFVTEPNVKPNYYHVVSGNEEQYRLIEPGERIQQELLTVEKYHFLDKTSSPCAEDGTKIPVSEVRGLRVHKCKSMFCFGFIFE